VQYSSYATKTDNNFFFTISSYNQKGKRFYEKPDVDILFSFSRIPCLPSQRQALSMPREAEVFVKNRAETSSRHLEARTAAFFPFITQ
jgi:hypothetical protein